MGDPRPEKAAIVTEVKDRLEQSTSVVVTEYRGLSVKALAELRTNLRPAGGAYKVYKNTLARRAASEAGVEIGELLVGPTALAFTETTPEGEAGDIVSVAKVLKEFAKTNPELIIKGGFFEGAPIDAAALGKLADLEPRDVLLAKLAGLMAAPMQQFAGLLQAVPRDFAYGLKALIEKGGGPNAAPDAPAAEAPAADAAEAPEAEEANADSAEAPAAEATEAPEAEVTEPVETNEQEAETAAEDGEQ